MEKARDVRAGIKMVALNEEKRARGGPKRMWMDCVVDDKDVAGVTEEDAENRMRWRWLICTSGPI